MVEYRFWNPKNQQKFSIKKCFILRCGYDHFIEEIGRGIIYTSGIGLHHGFMLRNPPREHGKMCFETWLSPMAISSREAIGSSGGHPTCHLLGWSGCDFANKVSRETGTRPLLFLNCLFNLRQHFQPSNLTPRSKSPSFNLLKPFTAIPCLHSPPQPVLV